QVDRAAAEAMRELFVEVVVAPAFADDAVTVFREKKNLRVVRLPAGEAAGWDWKRIRGGLLTQQRSRIEQVMDETRWKVVTKRPPNAFEWRDLRFAWAATKPRSESARGRRRVWTPRSWRSTRRANRVTIPTAPR